MKERKIRTSIDFSVQKSSYTETVVSERAFPNKLRCTAKKKREMQSTSSVLLLLLFLSLSTAPAWCQGVGPLAPCRTSDGRSGQCRPLVKCVRFLSEVSRLRGSPCSLRAGEGGVCCPHIVRGTATCKYMIICQH